MKKIGNIAVFILLSGLFFNLQADVKVKQETQTKYLGTFGKMISMFSKMNDKTKSTTFVKGDYLRTENDDEISIIDLLNERIITIKKKKKQYTILSFAEMKRKMEQGISQMEQMGGAEKQGKKPGAEKNWEIVSDVNRTGKKEKINGMNAEELILILTIKHKGVALEDSGGMVITADQWFSSDVSGYQEILNFNQRLMEKLDVPFTGSGMAGGMAMMLAQYPQVQEGMEKLNQEMKDMGKVPVRSNIDFEAVKGKYETEEMAADEDQKKDMPNLNKMLGGFAKKMMKGQNASDDGNKLMEINSEIKEISTAPLDDSLFEIPSGYKEIQMK